MTFDALSVSVSFQQRFYNYHFKKTYTFFSKEISKSDMEWYEWANYGIRIQLRNVITHPCSNGRILANYGNHISRNEIIFKDSRQWVSLLISSRAELPHQNLTIKLTGHVIASSDQIRVSLISNINIYSNSIADNYHIETQPNSRQSNLEV